MKTKTFLLVILLSGAITKSFSQNVDGDKYHENIDGVSLYYKETGHGVVFRAVNKTGKEVNVKIKNVSYTTEYGNKKTKDVVIRWVYPNKAANGVVSSYGKMKSWKFDSWEWWYNK